MAENEFVVSIEDISARKVGKGVDNSSQPSGNHEKLSTLIQEKLDKLLMEEDEQGGNPATLQKPKIQRVPPMLRGQNNFQKYFEPRAFSIGLLQYGNKKGVDEYKPKLAKRFIKERSTDGGKDLYMKIWNNIEKLRDCYDEDVTRRCDNESLAWMLFLDGCSTLQFIHILFSFGNNEQLINIRKDQIAFAQQDFFLLENQLPYQLLKLLMNEDDEEDNKNDKKKKKKSSDINEYKKSINNFIRTNLVVPPNYMQLFVDVESKQQEPAHLLELLRMSLVVHQQPTTIEDISNPYYWSKSYRSAKELNNVGITFKPNRRGTFTEVAFATRFLLFGELTLAPLIIEDTTKCVLLNLVAWEACIDGPGDDYWVTSYICFINSLLHDAEDVKVLISHNILVNYLENEQQVVDLFHEISNNSIPNPCANYLGVYDGIEKHLRSKVKLLIAEWLHAHFSNTWALLAFLGAIFAITLTLIQTYFAAYPPNKG